MCCLSVVQAVIFLWTNRSKDSLIGIPPSSGDQGTLACRRQERAATLPDYKSELFYPIGSFCTTSCSSCIILRSIDIMAAVNSLILWILLHTTAVATVFAMDPGPSNPKCREVRVKLMKIVRTNNGLESCKDICEEEIRKYGRNRAVEAVSEVESNVASTSFAIFFQPWTIDKCVVRPSAICYRGGSIENEHREVQDHITDELVGDSRYSDQMLHGCTSDVCSAPRTMPFLRRKKSFKVSIFDRNKFVVSEKMCICKMIIHYENVYIADQDVMPYQSTAVSCAYEEFVKRHSGQEWFPSVTMATERTNGVDGNDWTVSSAFVCSSKRYSHCPCQIEASEAIYCTTVQNHPQMGRHPRQPL
ncbi:hypothetical protein BCR37DRAFT_18105 [Protomyces lactucae-debilis]|uniref:Uncharacterized protein n=1 Tax=Protomyces lactucae-debilis TaxID=2754530 RepID=A0A1Y2FXP6_PROLT|nr:uncharacterized protein BCR37DRAFT_18105 [Protomyces lactucae-debilis]ORY87946.1 hypothetical protein BCR37DRAFT_18105 [Protomyces lactucae-debilis]